MPKPKPTQAEPVDLSATPDGLPPLSAVEWDEIVKAATVKPADLDAAGDLWRRYAGAMSGLWDAGEADESS